MIKVFIADDHAIVRRGLKQIISETSDMLIAGEAGSGEELLEKIFRNRYDVVLLDISLPGRSGIEVMKQLSKKKSKMPVLMLSIYPEEQYALRALKAGASGYLTKESAPEELVIAIRKIHHGEKYVSASLLDQLITQFDVYHERPAHMILSDREYQVMCLFASGKRAAEIAEQLSLSIQTVSTYKARILDKMEMHTIAEIVRYAVVYNLIG
jgi:two-component system, NarL family, invasion response regulator UvrY